jgi:hypothetical protein
MRCERPLNASENAPEKIARVRRVKRLQLLRRSRQTLENKANSENNAREKINLAPEKIRLPFCAGYWGRLRAQYVPRPEPGQWARIKTGASWSGGHGDGAIPKKGGVAGGRYRIPSASLDQNARSVYNPRAASLTSLTAVECCGPSPRRPPKAQRPRKRTGVESPQLERMLTGKDHPGSF